MKQQRLFVDLETSGLKVQDGAVVLSGCFLLDRIPENGESEVLEFVITPTEDEFSHASPEALRVNGFTWESLNQEGQPRREAVKSILNWLILHNVCAETTDYVGQNMSFDQSFLWDLMPAELEYVDFPTRGSDVIQLARQLAHKDPSVKFSGFSGAKIAQALEIEAEGELHLARGGTEACRRNYYEIMRRLSNIQGELSTNGSK